MERLESRLDGPILARPNVFPDERGFFQESFRASAWEDLGVTAPFVQDNHSRSTKGVVRGMHFSIGEGQAKLVRCGRGAIVDVLVDIRRDSPTYGEWEGFELSDENAHQLYVPRGFAHGFVVLTDIADVLYKCDAYYDGAAERGIAYDDPDIGIEWPADIELIVSERDATAPRLADVADDLPF